MEELSNLDASRPTDTNDMPLDVMQGGTYPYKDAVYMNNTPLYRPQVPEAGEEDEIPPVFAGVMSNLINEATGDDSNLKIKNREMLDAYNRMFDDQAKSKRAEDILNIATGMAERGVPARDVANWYNKQALKTAEMPENSGVYSELVDVRTAKMAEENETVAALLLDQTTDNIELANLVTKYMGALSNIDIFNSKVAEANAQYDEQGIAKQIGKGLLTGAAIPFIDNKTAIQVSSSLKEVFGEDFPIAVSVNTLFENARRKIYDAQVSMSPEEFKGLVDRVDEKLLNGTWLSLGDRQWFWNNLYNQNYRINTGVVAGEVYGAKVASKSIVGLSKEALKSGASKLAVAKAATVATMNEVIPGSGITALAVSKVANVPVRALALRGQKKTAAQLAAMNFNNACFLNTRKHVSELNKIGRSVMESVGSGTSKTLFGDAPIDILKTEPLNSISIVATSPYAKSVGLDKTNELFANMVKADKLGDFTSSVDKVLQDKFVADVSTRLEAQKPFVKSVSSHGGKNGFTTVLELGANDSNKGFNSIADAKAFAKNLNVVSDDFLGFKIIDSKPKMVSRADGVYVTLERNYGDIAKNADLGELSAAGIKTGFPKNKKLRAEFSSNKFLNAISTNLTIPHLHRTINNMVQETEGFTRSAMQDTLRSIDKGKGPILDTLMDITKSRGKWLTDETLASRGVPKQIIDAYDGMRQINDINYLFNGKSIIKDTTELNMKNVYAGGKRVGLGSVVTDFKNKDVHMLTYDETAKKMTTRIVHNTDEIKKGFTVYKMLFPVNGDAKFVAINNSVLSESAPSWSNSFMSYKPGRMTFSQGSGFIKQAKLGKTKDGKSFIQDVSTIFSHPNQLSVKKITGLLEDARQIAIKLNGGEITPAQAERLFQKLPDREYVKFASFNDFYKLCGKDKLISLDPDATLKYLPDGAKFSDALIGVEDAPIYNRHGISILEYTNSEAAVKKTARKEATVLNPFTLDEAPRVSIGEELAQEVEKIVQSNTEDYTRLYADDFKNTFGEWLTGPNKDMDAKEFLLWSNLDSIIKDEEALAMAKHARETYMLVKGAPDKADKWVTEMFNGWANKFIPGWKAPEEGNLLTLYKNFAHFNPLRKLRAFNFHFLLSFYNPRQLFIQAGAIANTVLISPKASGKVAEVIAPVMGYAMSGEKNMLVKAAKKLGVKTSYLEDLAEGAKALDIWSKGTFGGAFDVAERGKIWDKISSTYFYDKGEFFNRFFAAAVTQQEYLDKGIKHGILGLPRAAQMQGVVRQQNLYVNMGRSGSSQIQRGAMGVLTQFKGFPMRSVELLFDKTLTKAERMQFGLGQLAFGGTKGALGRRPALWIHEASRSLGVPEYVDDLVYNGILDQVVLDNDGHIGIGEFFSPQVMDIVGLAIDGKLWENIPAAQTLSRLTTGIAGAFNSLVLYGRSGELSSNTFASTMNIMTDMARKGALPGGPKNAMLGWWAWKTGQRLNSKGMLLDDGLTGFESFMIGLGFKDPNRDMEAIYAYINSSRAEKIEDLSKFITENINLIDKSATQQMADSRAEMLNNFLSSYNEEYPDIVDAAYKKSLHSWATKDMDDTVREKSLRAIAKSNGYGWATDKLKEEFEEANKRAKE